jgi:hypothetical protein
MDKSLLTRILTALKGRKIVRAATAESEKEGTNHSSQRRKGPITAVSRAKSALVQELGKQAQTWMDMVSVQGVGKQAKAHTREEWGTSFRNWTQRRLRATKGGEKMQLEGRGSWGEAAGRAVECPARGGGRQEGKGCAAGGVTHAWASLLCAFNHLSKR